MFSIVHGNSRKSALEKGNNLFSFCFFKTFIFSPSPLLSHLTWRNVWANHRSREFILQSFRWLRWPPSFQAINNLTWILIFLTYTIECLLFTVSNYWVPTVSSPFFIPPSLSSFLPPSLPLPSSLHPVTAQVKVWQREINWLIRAQRPLVPAPLPAEHDL